MRKLTTEEFIERAIAVHGDKYDYSNSIYKNRRSAIKILCPTHGEFTVMAGGHIDSCIGCVPCAEARGKRNRPLTTCEFISRSRKIHGNRYSYEESEYTRNNNKVKIFCNIHKGYFYQIASHHMNGHGCNQCCSTIHKNHKEGYMYSLISDDMNTVKIGITLNPKERFKSLKRNTPFDFTVTECVKFTSSSIAKSESFVHGIMGKNYGLAGFDGASEWFHRPLWFDDDFLNQILKS